MHKSVCCVTTSCKTLERSMVSTRLAVSGWRCKTRIASQERWDIVVLYIICGPWGSYKGALRFPISMKQELGLEMFGARSVKILRFASQAISMSTLGYHVTNHYLLSLLMYKWNIMGITWPGHWEVGWNSTMHIDSILLARVTLTEILSNQTKRHARTSHKRFSRIIYTTKEILRVQIRNLARIKKNIRISL